MRRGLRIVRGVMREGARSTRSQPLVAIATAVVCAAATAGTLATVGQTVAAEEELAAKLGGVDARTLVVRSTGAPVLPAGAVADLDAIDAVEWALGLGAPFAIHHEELPGRQAAAVEVVGLAPGIPRAEPWRAHAAYLSPASARRNGFTGPIGAVTDEHGATFDLVGWFDAVPPLDSLDALVTVPVPATDAPPLETIVVLARSPQDIPTVADAVSAIVGIDRTTDFTVTEPSTLLRVRDAAAGTLGSYGRSIVLRVLAVSMFLVAVTTLTGTLTRRQDFGRRRALGATRSMLTLLVVWQTLLAAIVGVIVGDAIGLLLLRHLTSRVVDPSYPVAVAALTLIASAAAAVVPASVAAWRDPLRVLRTP